MATNDHITLKTNSHADQADYGPGAHRYNDDLLIGIEPRERARSEFAAVFHLIDHPKLREFFVADNKSANSAKRRSHVAGFWAVLAAFLAIITAATESFWGQLQQPLPELLTVISGALGLVSFLMVYMGFLYGPDKHQWLTRRLHTERLRQFHFQAFIWRIHEMHKSLTSESEISLFQSARDQWLLDFESEFERTSALQLSAILDANEVPKVWLFADAGSQAPDISETHGKALGPIFHAYNTFRFAEQTGYASYMLRDCDPKRTTEHADAAKVNTARPKRKWPWYPGVDLPLRTKRKVLRRLWITALFGLVGVHISVIIIQVAKWAELGGGRDYHAIERGLHLMIVLGVFGALAAKTLLEGFSLTREIERYEEYLAVVTNLQREFLAATSTREKLAAMVAMERASFEEMRQFLRSNHEATFVM